MEKLSLPVRGAWIEMSMTGKHADLIVSLPVRGAWIEIIPRGKMRGMNASLPVRGAWIEMEFEVYAKLLRNVAPRAGSVD